MGVKLNLIVAACENLGIGKNGDLPWRLRTEMDHFNKMTSTTVDPNKQNVVIMGRKTWDSIPAKFKPLKRRINFVLSRSDMNVDEYEGTYHFHSLEKAVNKLEEGEFLKKYEAVWVIGGSKVYEDSLKSKHFYRLYFTDVLQHFDCDTFFPKFDKTTLKKVSVAGVPEGIQEEKGIKFEYHVYENPELSESH